MGERMSREEISANTSSSYGHQFRYHLASGYLKVGDRVVDAACGIGYGAKILLGRSLPGYPDIEYNGVDAQDVFPETSVDASFTQADLTTWEPSYDFDVFVGFETVEHLDDYTHYLEVAKRASRLILLSAPVIPTVHMNPWHKHDFTPGELVHIVEDKEWRCIQAIGQPSEFSEIYIFQRNE